MNNLQFEQESYAIRGAIYSVCRELGAGFTESVYHAGLCREFVCCNIPFVSEYEIMPFYKGEQLPVVFKVDFLCYGKILIEIKAVSALVPEHQAQIINYLRVSRLTLGFLVNFCSMQRAEIKRFVV